MASIELAPEEAALLKEILESYLSDLRMEIVDTDNMDFREMLKGREHFLRRFIGLLEAA
jgi:hypothetical protein